MSNSSTRQRFTQQFKDDAVGLVISTGYSCEETGRRLGVSANNISRWVRQCRDKLEGPSESGLSREQLEAELKRLRKESKRLEMEREILKKATAFFAKESTKVRLHPAANEGLSHHRAVPGDGGEPERVLPVAFSSVHPRAWQSSSAECVRIPGATDLQAVPRKLRLAPDRRKIER